jgi:hypothetical protein
MSTRFVAAITLTVSRSLLEAVQLVQQLEHGALHLAVAALVAVEALRRRWRRARR